MACDIMFMVNLCFLVMIAIHMTSCQIVQPKLYPFGREAGDQQLVGDDSSSPAIQIDPPIKYFSKKYSTLFVNTNGVISFGKRATSRILTRRNFPKPNGTPPTIAPFWNDIDGGGIWYRETKNRILLEKAAYDLDINWIAPSWLFIATWHRVQFHGAISKGRERENTFQVVLATDVTRNKSYAIFIYNNLVWDSSVTNGGWAEDGLAGTSPAVAGFDAGNGSDFVALDGSFTTDVQELDSQSNIGKRGTWVFNIKNRPEKDLCYKNQPCEHGQCYTNGIDKVERCNCDGTGFVGPLCTNDNCWKKNNPCKRGKCYTDKATAVVHCDCQGTGHAGPTCDRKPCATNPCNHGKCFTYLDGYDRVERCNCEGTGFHGKNCEIASWNYNVGSNGGPAKWAELYDTCSGARQSPVNIKDEDVQHVNTLEDIGFVNYIETQGVAMEMGNNGHSVKVSLTGQTEVKVTRGSLGGVYRAVQFHFHWGSTSAQGSEHLVNHHAYPMELHIVHYNMKYTTILEAIQHEDGLAVIGFMFEVGQENPNYSNLVNKLGEIQAMNDKVNLSTASMASFLPVTYATSKWYRYSGSLTTPTCNQVVTWTVMADSIQISESQLEQFRSVLDSHSQPIVDNYRPVQALNARVITANYKPASIIEPKSGKQYKVLTERDSKDIGHTASQEACRKIGGFLPQPQNKAENDFIGNLATFATRLGMTDIKHERYWRWDRDNSKVEWSNWWVKYPNGGRRANCGVMAGKALAAKYNLDKSGWIDKSCVDTKDMVHTTICEIGPPPDSDEWMTDRKTGKQYKVLVKKDGKDIGHTASQQACEDIGGFLPEPRNKDENDFIGNLATHATRLGMTDSEREHDWRWDGDNTKVEWSNWWVAYPNGGRKKNCGLMAGEILAAKYNLDKSGWIDKSCGKVHILIYNIVCERGIKYASAGAGGNIQPPAILMSVALGLCQLIHRI